MGGILSFTYFSVEGNDAGSAGLYIIFLILMLVGAFGTLFLQDPKKVEGSSASVDKEQPSTSWLIEIKESVKTFGTPEMMYLALMFFASGSNEPYALSTFTRFFDKSALGIEMIIFYSGSVCGSFFCGKQLDSVSKKEIDLLDHGSSTGGVFKMSLKIVVLFSVIHACAFALAAIVETKAGGWKQKEDLSESSIILPSACFLLW